VASAVSSPAKDYVKAGLSNGTDTAELHSMSMAVGRIADAPSGSGPFVVFTYSLSAVQALVRASAGSNSDIVKIFTT